MQALWCGERLKHRGITITSCGSEHVSTHQVIWQACPDGERRHRVYKRWWWWTRDGAHVPGAPRSKGPRRERLANAPWTALLLFRRRARLTQLARRSASQGSERVLRASSGARAQRLRVRN